MPPAPITDSDVGREPEPWGPQPPAGVFGGPGVLRPSNSEMTIEWAFGGSPHFLAEIPFQIIYPRVNTRIWHRVVIRAYCAQGKGYVKVEEFSGSNFPSHRLWVNGQLQETISQRSFSALWNLSPWPY